MPWELVFYAGFQEEMIASKFESYLKGGSGRAFARKHLLTRNRYEPEMKSAGRCTF